ncbi:MAG: DUF1772 domain-containing protein [OCS116 cluster bacterium]|uniref:DUF1772 domain-containing protein n=1 Tax=OCS116 cluster bacterium TaxID=2030921 RepID=A0A2A4ZA68_9PROT|nr:DUF1772 domain-containing protein [OCS116 cluster bacterium]
MKKYLPHLAITSLIFNAAIFGFFYAWVCSTMWGLDNADPNTAIAAMQAMNGSVRNATFAPAFFGTPFLSALVAYWAYRVNYKKVAASFAAAAIIYFTGGLLLTMVVNVPMNEALALIKLPQSATEATQIWNDYSAPWQFWNITRTIMSGIAFVAACTGLYQLGKASG